VPDPRAVPTAEVLIPDFCRWPSLLLLAVILELIAIALTLAVGLQANVMQRFMLITLYLQWSGLCSAALLCGARRWLRKAPPRVVFPVCWAMLVGVSVVVSLAGYEILFTWLGATGIEREPRATYLTRHLTIGVIVSFMVLQYFWLQHQWRGQVRAEGESRYQALQSRIRPHFLFNSLNSIAALAGMQPQEAEVLIEDLAELLRASLDERNKLVPLTDELALARAYLRIEHFRLGARLQEHWDVADDTLDVDVPLLSVQPLVENAVYHGIERLPAGGAVRIAARRENATLLVEVENPRVTGATAAHSGQKIAVDNIAQRLALIYGEHARLELGEDGDRFVSRLRLPIIVKPA